MMWRSSDPLAILSPLLLKLTELTQPSWPESLLTRWSLLTVSREPQTLDLRGGLSWWPSSTLYRSRSRLYLGGLGVLEQMSRARLAISTSSVSPSSESGLVRPPEWEESSSRSTVSSSS